MQKQNANRDLSIISTIGGIAALIFVVLFLSIQIIVPVAKLMSSRPARFGWHMWTVIPPRREIELVMRDGSTKTADLRPYIAQGRGELDLDHVLPPHLCRMMPDVAAVRYRSKRAVSTQTHTCP